MGNWRHPYPLSPPPPPTLPVLTTTVCRCSDLLSRQRACESAAAKPCNLVAGLLETLSQAGRAGGRVGGGLLSDSSRCNWTRAGAEAMRMFCWNTNWPIWRWSSTKSSSSETPGEFLQSSQSLTSSTSLLFISRLQSNALVFINPLLINLRLFWNIRICFGGEKKSSWSQNLVRSPTLERLLLLRYLFFYAWFLYLFVLPFANSTPKWNFFIVREDLFFYSDNKQTLRSLRWGEKLWLFFLLSEKHSWGIKTL